MDGWSVGQLRQRQLAGAQLVALRHPDGCWNDFPRDDDPIQPGMVAVFIVSLDAAATLRELAGG